MSDAIMLARVFFPDAVQFISVSTVDFTEVFPPDLTTLMHERFPGDFPDKLISTDDRATIHLEEIADGVYAGMSVWSRRVYIFERRL